MTTRQQLRDRLSGLAETVAGPPAPPPAEALAATIEDALHRALSDTGATPSELRPLTEQLRRAIGDAPPLSRAARVLRIAEALLESGLQP